MCFTWTDQSIKWFLTASRYTGFHKKLAQYILPSLTNDMSICDFGCGLGRLDIELAPFVKKIYAIDISQDVIDVLRQDIKVLSLNNVLPRCANADSLNETCDVGIMSFFGKSVRDMLYYRGLCNKHLIRIVNMQNTSTLYPTRHRKAVKNTAIQVTQELKQSNMAFEFIDTFIEFGQPLRSQEDAVAYVKSNAPNATLEEIYEFLETHVKDTGRLDYPLYLPNLKHLGIFIIS